MKRRPETSIDELVGGTMRGDIRAASRLIRLIDDRHPLARQALKALFPHAGRALVVGITGPPGAGKSTLTDCLIQRVRKENLSVGVLAVDPSSPLTGGAILGDRIRMNRFALDENVFVRSLASRGHFGGITPATRGAIRVMDAAGKDVIFVETVGVGQDEVDIARLAHTTIVVAVPGMGDDIQAMKAGILEVADVFVVNKADHPGADKTVADLENSLRRAPEDEWVPPVVKAQALHHQGIDDVWHAIERHRDYRSAGGARYREKLLANCRREIQAFVYESLQEKLAQEMEKTLENRAFVQDIASGKADIYVATDQILSELRTWT
ncbi:MAG: methylmalonyl Co-A mutase-associated GTPase MeaB [Gammaproteobacteria bacterium]